ncbi:MAG: serine hydrolase [Bacteroidota bacterium]|nr:serine hydrolase [Bacteroidota bacterium]
MKKAILLLLLFPCFASAQKSHPVLLDKYMTAQENINGFSGTVLVAQKGKVIYEKAFGLADKELNVKNKLQSVYQIASLTKQFTACAILLLAEDGKLSLNDKLDKFFPDFPKGDSITIHMLLSHTSGLKTTGELDGFVEALKIREDSMLALIKRQPLDFSPGTNFHYSNLGYFLLGMIIEKVTAQSYSDYMLHHIFLKAGLNNTFVSNWDTILVNRTRGYEKTASGWRNNSHYSMEGPFSAGAIVSTVEDLNKWNTALLSNKIISAASIKLMTTPNLNTYGYGLLIDTFMNHYQIWHNGQLRGFISYLGSFPQDSVTIVVLSNNESNSTNIANVLAAIVFGKDIVPPYRHVESKIDTAIMAKYVGQYELSANDKIEIIKTGDKLYRQKAGSHIELKPESTTKFFYGDGSDRQIEFEVNKSGKIETVFFISGGFKNAMKRVFQ